jgi:CheY-like chemotaxis protein
VATVLLVDDEPDVRSVLREVLELGGHTVLEATSGRTALATLAGGARVDLVLSDIRMPDGDGWSLLAEIRRRDPVRPAVVLITGFSDVTAEQARARGAQELVSKPCEVLALLDTIEAHAARPVPSPSA